MLKLYENIKILRMERGMSQAELAKLAGYTDRSSIAKIEKGLVDLSQSKIKVFADVFGVSTNELMGDTQEEQSPYYLNSEARDMAQFLFENPEYKVLFSACRDVPPEDIGFVKDFLDRVKR